jgi:hypothetical protein
MAAGVLLAATLTGCSAGQQSQTATQEPAVNGASGGVGIIALRDVRIRVDQTGPEVKAGRDVDLLFVATNQSLTENDRLLSITSDVGEVTLTPAHPEIPASQALVVGKPDNSAAEALQAASSSVKATSKVHLNQPIRNGLTYKFVFNFEHAGQTTIGVPLTAGDYAPRVAPATPHTADH